MQTLISTLAISGFEWIFLVGIPAVLILAGIIYIIVSNKQLNRLRESIYEMIEKLDLLDGCNINHITELELYADESDSLLLSKSIHNLINDSKEKYQGKWLPELDNELNFNNLAELQLKSSLQFTPSILIFTCGLIASLVLAIVPEINPQAFQINKLLVILPFIVGTLVSLFLINHRSVLRQRTLMVIDSLKQEIERYLPVYSDKAGLALLVNEMTGHEESINNAMTEFNSNLESFVSDDFKDNISSTIKDIMQEEIAPPINQSTQLLADLTEELSHKQNEGMAELAKNFSDELTLAMSKNFNSLEEEMSSFNSLMDETMNFIQDSIAILENSRQQNILLSREVSESIELMTVAKNDIANEMATMADYLEVISSVTEKMTTVYAGEDANLKEQIGSLELALKNSLETLNTSIAQSESTMSMSSKLKDQQEKQSELLLEKMNGLVNELGKIDSSINQATTGFKEKSADNVKKTLTDFEQALADVVERLIYTTAEIRDAVEALPLALSSDPGKDK